MTKDGETVHNIVYHYDALNRLTALEQDGEIVAEYTYDVNGNRASLTCATGTVTTYSYNLANWVTGMTSVSGGTVLTDYSYTYYADGNRRSETDRVSNAVTTYVYDDLGRLVQESETDGLTISYTYDLSGNRTQMAVSGAENYTVEYTYDANNRLEQEKKTQGITTTTTLYTYDDNGNLLRKGTVDGAELYEYNGFNQLVILKQGEGGAAYGYNASGIRVSKQVGDTYTYYLLDGGDVVGECENGSLSAIYTRGFNLIYRLTMDGMEFYLHDAHGDVVALTDGFGAVTKRYSYDAFGNEENPSDSDSNPFRYCGEYFDKETKTYYLRARYYDPAIGRFTQQDPIKYGFNWYVYCSNNPISFVDPLGLFDYNTRLTCGSAYNEDVEALQNALVNLGYLDASKSRWGYFDSQTLAAVNAYKNAVGLWNFGEYEGVVGITTWESLGLVYRTQADIDIGVSIAMDGHRVQYKDFTIPIQNALDEVVDIARSKGRFNYRWFISQVDHEKAWDIKREVPWNQTIGENTYPGFGVQVYFQGILMTLEQLGNYTYGYIGIAMGLTSIELLGGSWYAAGFPVAGPAWDNEHGDWYWIMEGAYGYLIGGL